MRKDQKAGIGAPDRAPSKVKILENHNNQNMVKPLISSFSTMLVSFPVQTTAQQHEALFVGSHVRAATEVLLRIREEVITTLDRQVNELQQIHPALASAPAPTIVAEAMHRPPTDAPARATEMPSLFENAPRIPNVQFASLPNACDAKLPTPATPIHQPRGEVAFATAQVSGVRLSESALDPMLEQATLEELNDALASAFAMVSSRSI